MGPGEARTPRRHKVWGHEAGSGKENSGKGQTQSPKEPAQLPQCAMHPSRLGSC
jgi:hypothetical protein